MVIGDRYFEHMGNMTWMIIRDKSGSDDPQLNLVSRFLAWIEESGIQSVGGMNPSPGSHVRCLFRPVDAERVLAWLRAQEDVEETDLLNPPTS